MKRTHDSLYAGLLEALRAHPVVDSHEHIPSEREALEIPYDALDLVTPYVSDDLLSAGMPPAEWRRMVDRRLPFEERFSCLEPYLPAVYDTAYFRAVRHVLRDIYGCDRLDAASAVEVTAKIRENITPGFYARAFGRCGIRAVLTYIPYAETGRFDGTGIIPVPTVNDLCPRSLDDLEDIARNTGEPVVTFDDLVDRVDGMFDRYRKAGLRTIKFSSGYRRVLEFPERTRAEAEEAFVRIVRAGLPQGETAVNGAPGTRPSPDAALPLEDYLTRRMLSHAGRLGMTAVFHTGIHAWDFNSVRRCRPAGLESLIAAYRTVRFVLLHAGVPFIDEALVLSKYYPNCHLNMTWLQIIDTVKARELADRCIEMLPSNKLTAFGGDYSFVENIYGHWKMMTENLAAVLVGRIRAGEMTEKRALETAGRWLFENPADLHGLPRSEQV